MPEVAEPATAAEPEGDEEVAEEEEEELFADDDAAPEVRRAHVSLCVCAARACIVVHCRKGAKGVTNYRNRWFKGCR